MAGKKPQLGDLLVEARLVRPDQLHTALQQQAVFGGHVGKTLIRLGAITEETLMRFLAGNFGLEVARLEGPFDPGLLALVPRDMAEKLAVFPVATRKDGRVDVLVLAMADPTNIEAVDAVSFKTGRRIAPLIAAETAIEAAIRTHYYGERRREVAAQSPVQFAGNDFDLSPDSETEPDIPVVTGVLHAATPPVYARPPEPAVMDLVEAVDEVPLPPTEPELQFAALQPPLSATEPDLRFAALQAPLSELRSSEPRPPGGFAPPMPPAPRPPVPAGPGSVGSVAGAPMNVRSTGSAPPAAARISAPPETPMANPTPEQLAAAPFCSDCGATRVAGAKFCPHCGMSFTGAVRAKGAPPAVAPATRPMMPAVTVPGVGTMNALAGIGKPGEPLDIEALEGIRMGKLIPLRPRTAVAANVDEPAEIGGKQAPLGLGVTALVPSVVTDASNPDDPAVLTGAAAAHRSPVAPMALHKVSASMARVDDTDALAPSNGAPAPSVRGLVFPPRAADAPRSEVAAPTLAIASPVAASKGAAAAAAGGFNTEAVEGISRTSILTAIAALADDAEALQKGAGFRLHLGVTHMPSVLADASLVDDPAVLSGGKAESVRILRAVMHENLGKSIWGGARIDDITALVAAAPRSAASLARDWADVAERPIPRKDDRTNAPVPKSREVFFAPEAAPPPPPPPEPKVEYIPAPPAMAAAPAPWAAFSGGEAPKPEPAKPLSATAIVSLDQLELRALAERLVKSGAVTADDLDAAKKK